MHEIRTVFLKLLAPYSQPASGRSYDMSGRCSVIVHFEYRSPGSLFRKYNRRHCHFDEWLPKPAFAIPGTSPQEKDHSGRCKYSIDRLSEAEWQYQQT